MGSIFSSPDYQNFSKSEALNELLGEDVSYMAPEADPRKITTKGPNRCLVSKKCNLAAAHSILPCGHVCVCNLCVEVLQRKGISMCPQCSCSISGVQ